MVYGKLVLISLLAGATVSAFAQSEIGQIDLDYIGQASNNGTFEWQIDGTSTDVFTYCFSTNNDFAPWENPQVFNVWTIAGADAASVDASGMLSNNNMTNLTAKSFLAAAAQAEAYGTPGLTSTDAANNDTIHTIESEGDTATIGGDYSQFLYLQQANPTSYSYGGQPQGLIIPGGGIPNITPEPVTTFLCLGAAGLAFKRRLAARA
jgi:hypothetical protein